MLLCRSEGEVPSLQPAAIVAGDLVLTSFHWGFLWALSKGPTRTGRNCGHRTFSNLNEEIGQMADSWMSKRI